MTRANRSRHFCIQKRACELNKSQIISTDEDPGLRIERFAVINLRGVSTNKTIIYSVLADHGFKFKE
jgi:hypothetical protein